MTGLKSGACRDGAGDRRPNPHIEIRGHGGELRWSIAYDGAESMLLPVLILSMSSLP